MFNLKDLQNARSRVTEVRENKSENVYDKALNLFDFFFKTGDVEILKEASKNFNESIQLNKNHYPSYFCLSYIFYVLDNTELALKYLQKAEELCNFKIPEEFIKLREKIINDKDVQNLYNKNLQQQDMSHVTIGNKEISRPIPVKAVVSKTSSFWKAIQQEAVSTSKQIPSKTNVPASSNVSSKNLESFENQKKSSFIKSLKF